MRFLLVIVFVVVAAVACAHNKCPPGQLWDGEQCAAYERSCAPGLVWNGAKCARPGEASGHAPPRTTSKPASKGSWFSGDRDGDGIKDDVDRCPDAPEDKDGFEDEDGCPEPDNDRDGIPDVQDRCPNEPEDMDGVEDGDGCPEP